MRQIAAFALITNRKGEILLVKQRTGNRFWTLPGGKVGPGETIATALRREVLEETGLTVQPGDLVAVVNREVRRTVALIFAAKILRGKPRHFTGSPEISAVAYAPRRPLPSGLSFQAKGLLRALGGSGQPKARFIDLKGR
ncbi:MAG: NUDIX hydrolase [Verrucomicrobiia bacterium]